MALNQCLIADCESGNHEAVENLIKSGQVGNINGLGESDVTALQIAAAYGHVRLPVTSTKKF